ncbi:MAG: acetyl-CoA carboxylase biotin carboxyl carrier protein subunit [Thermoanaerobaculia bacterium]
MNRKGTLYEVTVGERTYQVDAATARAGLRSLRIDSSQHEVAVRHVRGGATREGTRGADDKYWVSTPSGAGPVSVTDPLTHLAAQTRGGKGARRAARVTAYMPGRVVAILAREGEAVTAGQGIVVLEAMKMQNEIRAEQDGTLAKIHVEPGQAVEGGDPLFELE